MTGLLHDENLTGLPFAGKSLAGKLENRIATVKRTSRGLKDPDVSILIRTRNDIAYMPGLFADINAQEFSGNIEIVIVDTESSDGTADFAHDYGAKVISIKQRDFTYPKALNMGFTATTHPYVVTLVGHTNLVSRYMLKALTIWSQNPLFGGMFGLPFPNWDTSKTEKLFWMVGGGHSWLEGPQIQTSDKIADGLMASNASIVRRSVWRTLGGYDESYAGGGEDRALGLDMLSSGLLIVREPLCFIYHSHHLGPINIMRQNLHWKRIAKPSEFNEKKILSRRPDLRNKNLY